MSALYFKFEPSIYQQVWHASKNCPEEYSKDSPYDCIPHHFREIIPREPSQTCLDRVVPRDLQSEATVLFSQAYVPS